MSEAEIINRLISDTFTGNVNDLFIKSSECGHIEVVKILLTDSRVDPCDDNNYAIRLASERGHIEVVKLLLKDPRVDPGDDNNFAIEWASRNGHVEVVKILLMDSRVDPGANYNFAIEWASYYGHTKVVKILLKDSRVDPGADSNYAIRWASRNGHVEVVKLLLESLKHRFSLDTYIKIESGIEEEIKELLINHMITYQWYLKTLLVQHLTIDLLPQINHFIIAN